MLVDYLQETQKKYKKFKEAGDSRYIYQNEWDKTCFQHDMAYVDFKDLTRRIGSDKILKIWKNDGYERGLASKFYNFFDKKYLVEQSKIKLIKN